MAQLWNYKKTEESQNDFTPALTLSQAKLVIN